jgi:hypothetical protein
VTTEDPVLDAAERLLATRGLTGVSLYEIDAAAGPGGSSRQGRFAELDDVIRAVLHRHMVVVDEQRAALMAELEDDGMLRTARGISEAVILPLAARLGSPSGRHYLQILGEMSGWDPVRAMDVSDIAHNRSLMTCAELMEEVMADQPARVRGLRRQVLLRIVLRSLGDQAQWDAALTDDAIFTGNLIDLAEAALLAPVSEATASLLDGEA